MSWTEWSIWRFLMTCFKQRNWKGRILTCLFDCNIDVSTIDQQIKSQRIMFLTCSSVFAPSFDCKAWSPQGVFSNQLVLLRSLWKWSLLWGIVAEKCFIDMALKIEPSVCCIGSQNTWKHVKTRMLETPSLTMVLKSCFSMHQTFCTSHNLTVWPIVSPFAILKAGFCTPIILCMSACC